MLENTIVLFANFWIIKFLTIVPAVTLKIILLKLYDSYIKTT